MAISLAKNVVLFLLPFVNGHFTCKSMEFWVKKGSMTLISKNYKVHFEKCPYISWNFAQYVSWLLRYILRRFQVRSQSSKSNVQHYRGEGITEMTPEELPAFLECGQIGGILVFVFCFVLFFSGVLYVNVVRDYQFSSISCYILYYNVNNFSVLQIDLWNISDKTFFYWRFWTFFYWKFCTQHMEVKKEKGELGLFFDHRVMLWLWPLFWWSRMEVVTPDCFGTNCANYRGHLFTTR